MAPRGRPRKPSRMDAAVDAMIPFGFPKALVLKKMNELLKEYGGDVGYPFIEAEAYKVLIDAILASEEEESKQEGETSMKDDSLENEMVGDHAALVTVGPSGENVEPLSQTPNSATQNDCRAQGDENSWKDIVLDQTCSQDMRIVEAADCASGYSVGDVPLHDPPVCSPPGGSSAAQQRASPAPERPKPCYGWVSDGEDDDVNFVILTPGRAFEFGGNLRSPSVSH